MTTKGPKNAGRQFLLESKYARHSTTAEQELCHFRNHITLNIEWKNITKKMKKKEEALILR